MSQQRKGTPAQSRDKASLSRDVWLDAAAGAIAEGGFGNVRILVLAKKLGVTRGSFYWHFQDHAEFIQAFLTRWRDRRIQELEYWRPAETDDARTALMNMVNFLLSEPARNLRRLRVELAVRDYARRDDYAAAMVDEVDRARLAQAKDFIARIEPDDEAARDMALLLYVSTVGSQVVLTGPVGDEETIERVERLITRVMAGRE